MVDEEWKKLLLSSEGDKYIFDKDTTFIKEQIITVQAGGNFYNGSQSDKKPDRGTSDLNPVQKELLPIFMNDYDEMMSFYHAINGAKPTAITELVNKKVKEDKIPKARCKTDLWTVLNKHGFYAPSLSNWNTQIN